MFYICIPVEEAGLGGVSQRVENESEVLPMPVEEAELDRLSLRVENESEVLCIPLQEPELGSRSMSEDGTAFWGCNKYNESASRG